MIGDPKVPSPWPSNTAISPLVRATAKILMSVAIEISGDGLVCGQRDAGARLKGACRLSGAQQDGHATARSDGYVGMPIAVKIGGGRRSRAGWIRQMQPILVDALALVQQHRDKGI